LKESFAAKPVVWQRNQSNSRLISPSDDHYGEVSEKRRPQIIRRIQENDPERTSHDQSSLSLLE